LPTNQSRSSKLASEEIPDDHAGNTEVTLILAVNPNIAKQPLPNDPKSPHNSFEWDRRIIEVQPDGVIDEHSKWVATPEIGEKLLDIRQQSRR